MNERTVLVTGASSGIGLELAGCFAADGWRVILLARKSERLTQSAEGIGERFGVQVDVLEEELADAHAPERVARYLDRRAITLDALVNNAGFGAYAPVHLMDPATLVEMMQVNVTAVVLLTRLVLPGMIARGRGMVLNVASVGAFQPGPTMAAYYASRAFVASFSLALSEELRGTGVTSTVVCPGPTRTAFFRRAGHQHTLIARGLPIPLHEPLHVARVAYRAARKGRPMVVPGIINKFVVVAVRFAPRMVAARVAKRLHQ